MSSSRARRALLLVGQAACLGPTARSVGPKASERAGYSVSMSL